MHIIVLGMSGTDVTKIKITSCIIQHFVDMNNFFSRQVLTFLALYH